MANGELEKAKFAANRELEVTIRELEEGRIDEALLAETT